MRCGRRRFHNLIHGCVLMVWFCGPFYRCPALGLSQQGGLGGLGAPGDAMGCSPLQGDAVGCNGFQGDAMGWMV